MDTSMQSLPDEPMTSEDMLGLSEYAEDIHRHLRESEVRYCFNSCHLGLMAFS